MSDEGIRRAIQAAGGTADLRVVISMNPDGQSLNINTRLPAPMALAMVHSAYLELVSLKVRTDLKSERRVIDPNENGGV